MLLVINIISQWQSNANRSSEAMKAQSTDKNVIFTNSEVRCEEVHVDEKSRRSPTLLNMVQFNSN